MAVPKHRTSKSKRDKRRSHHALSPIGRSACPSCGANRLPHCVCSACGFYAGKVMLTPKKKTVVDQDFAV